MNELLITLCGLIYRLLGNEAYQLIPRIQRWKSIQSGWAESSGSALKILPWVFGILLASLAAFAIITNRREAKRRREREIVYFRRKAVDKELEEKQMKLLTEAIQVTGFSRPYRLLDSFDIFQGFFHSYEEKQDFSDQEHQYFHEVLDELKENRRGSATGGILGNSCRPACENPTEKRWAGLRVSIFGTRKQ